MSPPVSGEAPVARRPATARWVAAVLGVLVIGGLVATVPRLGQDPADSLAAHSPLLGRQAPSFSLSGVVDGGTTVTNAQLAGHFAVVYFFASWCPSCAAEVPSLVGFYWKWHPRGVDMVGIGYGDTPAAEAAFAKQWGITWPVVSDPADRVALSYGVFGIPETFVIGPRGQLLAKLVGELQPGQLGGVIEQLMAGGAPVSSRNGGFVPSPIAPRGPSGNG